MKRAETPGRERKGREGGRGGAGEEEWRGGQADGEKDSRDWETAHLSGREEHPGGERAGNRTQPVTWEPARATFPILPMRKLRPGEGKWFVQGQVLERLISLLSLHFLTSPSVLSQF